MLTLEGCFEGGSGESIAGEKDHGATAGCLALDLLCNAAWVSIFELSCEVAYEPKSFFRTNKLWYG